MDIDLGDGGTIHVTYDGNHVILEIDWPDGSPIAALTPLQVVRLADALLGVADLPDEPS